jgi:hypothetical protein
MPLESFFKGKSISLSGNPHVIIAVPLVLTIVAFLAVWMPARRASRIDPLIASGMSESVVRAVEGPAAIPPPALSAITAGRGRWIGSCCRPWAPPWSLLPPRLRRAR